MLGAIEDNALIEEYGKEVGRAVPGNGNSYKFRSGYGRE